MATPFIPPSEEQLRSELKRINDLITNPPRRRVSQTALYGLYERTKALRWVLGEVDAEGSDTPACVRCHEELHLVQMGMHRVWAIVDEDEGTTDTTCDGKVAHQLPANVWREP